MDNITEWVLVRQTKTKVVFELVEDTNGKILKDRIENGKVHFIEFSKIKFTNGDEFGT